MDACDGRQLISVKFFEQNMANEMSSFSVDKFKQEN